MKRTITIILSLIFIGTLSASLFSCKKGERVPDGVYSGVVSDCGEVYTFQGRKVRLESYLLGSVAVDLSGTYKLSGDEITFHFPDDDLGVYSRTLKFSIAEDGGSITIDGDVFTLLETDTMPAESTESEQ